MVPPSQLNKNLSPQLERIVMKCLQKERDDRYKYTSEVAEDLQRFLFSSNQPFARTDLQRYMKQHFKAEIDKEYARLEAYKGVTMKDVEPEEDDIDVEDLGAQSAAPAPAPVPDALAPRPITVASTLAAPVPSNPGMPAPPNLAAGMGMPAAASTPAGLPGWAKGLIAGLSAVVLVALGIVLSMVLGKEKAPGQGILTVEAKPAKVAILIDGKQVASEAPFSVKLAAGSYVLEVRAEGHKTVMRGVKIIEDDARVESVVLESDKQSSILDVSSEPSGLAIWLDGKDTGKSTPAAIVDLVAGEHELVLKRGDEVAHSQRVALSAGDTKKVDVALANAPPVLEVASTPERARVLVGGKEMGTTPLVLDSLAEGAVTVRVEKVDCEPYEQRVSLAMGGRAKVEANLKCRGEAAPVASNDPGRLNVSATLVADIFLNGDKIGRTPAIGLKVPPGIHTLKLVPLAADKSPHTESINVEAGKLRTVSHTF